MSSAGKGGRSQDSIPITLGVGRADLFCGMCVCVCVFGGGCPFCRVEEVVGKGKKDTDTSPPGLREIPTSLFFSHVTASTGLRLELPTLSAPCSRPDEARSYVLWDPVGVGFLLGERRI